MTLRLDIEHLSHQQAVRLQGYLSEEVATDTLRVCQEIEGEWFVDATDLLGADETGLAVLRRWQQQGIRLRSLRPGLLLRLASE